MKTTLLKNLLCVLPVLLSSCEYQNFTTYRIKEGNNFINYYYSQRNEKKIPNKKIIIFLEGSEYCSTLGIMRSFDWWEALTPANSFNNQLSDCFDLLVPEKININMGEDFSADSLKSMANTFAHRLRASEVVIDSFLNTASYDSIYLAGYSEGGLILPKVYNSLKLKEKITGLVSISCGGYSYYNIIKALYKSRSLDTSSIDTIISGINKEPNSFSKTAFGQPYIKWSNFMFFEPSEEYKKIDIPVLLIHGTNDQFSPIESARFLKNKFLQWNKSNLTYIEFENMNHNFNGDFYPVIRRIEMWIGNLNN